MTDDELRRLEAWLRRVEKAAGDWAEKAAGDGDDRLARGLEDLCGRAGGLQIAADVRKTSV